MFKLEGLVLSFSCIFNKSFWPFSVMCYIMTYFTCAGGKQAKKGGASKSKPPSAKKEKTMEKEKTKMTEKDGKGEEEMKEEDIVPVTKEAVIGKKNY